VHRQPRHQQGGQDRLPVGEHRQDRHQRRTTGPLGIEADLAAAPSGSLLVGAWANGSSMYLNDTHKTKWSTVLALGDGGAGFRDLTFVTSKIAWAVYGPVSAFPGDFGKLYVTHDGGTT
jgi:hypothetical protein